ncbi:MAG: hypothetical protein AAGD00_10590 [Planctomycetota bacterium]
MLPEPGSQGNSAASGGFGLGLILWSFLTVILWTWQPGAQPTDRIPLWGAAIIALPALLGGLMFGDGLLRAINRRRGDT